MRLPPPPEQKTISSGSQERWESTSWVLGQENKFSFPGVIFLRRFLCCFFGGGAGGCFGLFWLQGEEIVVRLTFSPVSDTEMCLTPEPPVRGPG